jgi:hypothetical protein
MFFARMQKIDASLLAKITYDIQFVIPWNSIVLLQLFSISKRISEKSHPEGVQTPSGP